MDGGEHLAAANYRRTRAPERVEQVVEAAKAGRIEITACYLHNHFEILGTNQLHRITWEGEWWKRRGVPLTSAMLSDIPGATWGVIPVLASAGVRYLFMAPNNFGAPFHRCNPPPRPFYWRARGGEELLSGIQAIHAGRISKGNFRYTF